jgi:protein-tyrosine kinase
MSKIRKALDRIQVEKGSANSRNRRASGDDDSVIVAKLVEQSVDAGSIRSNKKRIHLDRAALQEAGLIAPDIDEHVLANQYREIKRPLIAHAFGKRATRIDDGNLIVVTSAMPGEGKTFTSINLALSMAQERDHDVLLVDADSASQRTSEMLGATGEMGLLDVLEDPEIPVMTLVLPTDVDGLSILPAGQARHHATELFASSVMEDVIQTLAHMSKGQIVIFDSPPILLTSEAKVLSSLAGQVVLVVRAGETAQDAVESALTLLGEDQIVNLVLNQVRSGFAEYRYGYGHGYQYGKK